MDLVIEQRQPGQDRLEGGLGGQQQQIHTSPPCPRTMLARFGCLMTER
jgi:hypothetical protein